MDAESTSVAVVGEAGAAGVETGVGGKNAFGGETVPLGDSAHGSGKVEVRCCRWDGTRDFRFIGEVTAGEVRKIVWSSCETGGGTVYGGAS
jgi:hypothetical protein